MTGPRFAFFDVDETLIAFKSMFDFFPFWCEHTGQPTLEAQFERAFAKARTSGTPREALNRLYYRFFRGASISKLDAMGVRWFLDRFTNTPSPYQSRVVERLHAHRIAGVEPVLVSGSMLPLLRPIAQQLQVKHILCTRLLSDVSGRLTGEIGTPQTIGDGKAAAVRQFLAQQDGAAAGSFAYGDDITDTPMLRAVGHAVVVGVQPELLELCRQRAWSHLPV